MLDDCLSRGREGGRGRGRARARARGGGEGEGKRGCCGMGEGMVNHHSDQDRVSVKDIFDFIRTWFHLLRSKVDVGISRLNLFSVTRVL